MPEHALEGILLGIYALGQTAGKGLGLSCHNKGTSHGSPAIHLPLVHQHLISLTTSYNILQVEVAGGFSTKTLPTPDMGHFSPLSIILCSGKKPIVCKNPYFHCNFKELLNWKSTEQIFQWGHDQSVACSLSRQLGTELICLTDHMLGAHGLLMATHSHKSHSVRTLCAQCQSDCEGDQQSPWLNLGINTSTVQLSHSHSIHITTNY